MSRTTDRDLLFGLLALQINFIDRDTLVDAFHRWAADRGEPLDRILLDKCALSPSRHALVAGLVEEQIKLHGADPRKSLAAVSSIGSVREELSRINDPELQASLAASAPVHQSTEPGSSRQDWPATAPPAQRSATASLGVPSSAGMRFVILRPHARGGLGQVSVAMDQELDRPVALKEIQDRHADEPDSRARFVQEAEITGKLEHPGIIPVYGLGHDAAGRPFYAMRFIQGDSLKEAIERFHGDSALRTDPARRSARLRELLRRFTDVCNAVAYAHSRGVLHRDIKPGNIMLGPYGETLVVDWGLAKPLGRAAAAEPEPEGSLPLAEGPIRLSDQSGSRDETAAGRIVGTPAYASPEQVAGRLDLLGSASDVYGLGATLYALLTGRAPVESGELEEILRRVQRGEIPPPRSLDPTIPRPLEAICQQAMAARPEDRYASARALAADVTRWLDDQPVTAYREPVTVRAGRWMRRHRTLVTSAAAVLVFGVLGLSGFATVLAGKNRELDAKNAQLADKNRELDARNVELAGKNHALDRQKRRAEERESLAIEAVTRFSELVGSSPELKDRPEVGSLRRALLKEPLQFFQRLRDQLQADRDTRPEALAKLARANYNLAYTTAEIGSPADAIRSFSEAITIWEQLTRDDPTSATYQKGLGASYHRVGSLLQETGQTSGAMEALRRAMAIWERLARGNPAVTEYQSQLGWTHHSIGMLLGDTRPDEAMESFRRALEIHERLARDNPSSADHQYSLASTYWVIGNLLMNTGKTVEALASFRRALPVQERLAHDHPAHDEYQVGLAATDICIGILLGGTGHLNEALQSQRQALEIRSRLATDHPAVARFQSNLALSHEYMGTLLKRMDQSARALDSYGRALAIWERLARDHPSILDYQSNLAHTLNHLAETRIGQGQWTEARDLLEQSVERQRKALAVMPNHRIYLHFFRDELLNLARVYKALDRPAEMARTARELASLLRGSPVDLYNIACGLALAVPRATAEQRRALAAEAVAMLKRAIAAGWNDARHTSRDPDLIPLRDRDDFRRLLAEMFDRGFPDDPFAR